MAKVLRNQPPRSLMIYVDWKLPCREFTSLQRLWITLKFNVSINPSICNKVEIQSNFTIGIRLDQFSSENITRCIGDCFTISNQLVKILHADLTRRSGRLISHNRPQRIACCGVVSQPWCIPLVLQSSIRLNANICHRDLLSKESAEPSP